MVLVDAHISRCTTGIETSLFAQNSTSLLLQNVAFLSVGTSVLDNVAGQTLIAGGSSVLIDSWDFGLVSNSSKESTFATGQSIPVMNRTQSLLSTAEGATTNNLFIRRRPTYTDIAQSQIFDVTAYGVVGDGVTDNTAGLNSVFAIAANLSSIVYIPFGVYIVTDTVHIPLGSRIVGQAWSQIMLKGSRFQEYVCHYFQSLYQEQFWRKFNSRPTTCKLLG